MPNNGMESRSPCEYARERHQNIARWRNLWTILVFAFGSAIVLFLILAILLFIRSDWLPGAVSALGTIVSSVGISWVLARRREAVEEEDKAYEDVIARCQTSASADALRSRLTLFGGIR